jgi:mono/diheme cytochrome c family protein
MLVALSPSAYIASVAEVPEHLLQRSAERRAALTGVGGGEGAESATPAVSSGGAPAAAAPAAAPPKVTPTEPAFIDPVDKAAFQRVQAIRKRRIPVWAMGVMAVVPLWGFLYVGAFGERHGHEEVVTGQTVYANNCASCHGSNGQGGAGPKLSGGESNLTFPDEAAHVEWVANGSTAFRGRPYGDPARPGGQRGPATGGMPAFGSRLSQEEIDLVVAYEREEL